MHALARPEWLVGRTFAQISADRGNNVGPSKRFRPLDRNLFEYEESRLQDLRV